MSTYHRAPGPRVAQRIHPQEAADALGVSIRTIRRWVAEGKLTAYRVGPKLLRLDPAEVDALSRQLPTAPVRVGRPAGGAE